MREKCTFDDSSLLVILRDKIGEVLLCLIQHEMSLSEDKRDMYENMSLTQLLNMRDSRGRTMLVRACDTSRVNESVVRCLVRGGVDVNVTDDRGRTPLMALCSHWVGYNESVIRW